MKQILFLITLLPTLFFAQDFQRGVDISYLPTLEERGNKFYDGKGRQKDLLKILTSNGVNAVRLRLWVNNKSCNLEQTLAFAKRVKAAKMSFLLDFHYSDSWADPGKQAIPESWKKLSYPNLRKRVYDYTKEVLLQFKKQKTLPEWVQIGNEVNHGLLWEYGRRKVKEGVPMCELFSEGVKATREVLPKTKIMIHHAGGKGAERFFNTLLKNNVDYDIMGFSYYPWHHDKDIEAFRSLIYGLSKKHHKKIAIAETSYPWTLENNDKSGNKVSDLEQILTNYQPTIEGQYQFVKDWMDWLKGHNGVGFYYWAPEYVSTPNDPAYKWGSSRENLSFFDFEHKPLKVLRAYKK